MWGAAGARGVGFAVFTRFAGGARGAEGVGADDDVLRCTGFLQGGAEADVAAGGAGRFALAACLPMT